MDTRTLTTSELVRLWTVSERTVRSTLARLETLGFSLERDPSGARLVPLALARAVQDVRLNGEPLESLRSRTDLLPPPEVQDPTLFELMVEARASLSVLRETVNALAVRLEDTDPMRFSILWPNFALPDPRARS